MNNNIKDWGSDEKEVMGIVKAQTLYSSAEECKDRLIGALAPIVEVAREECANKGYCSDHGHEFAMWLAVSLAVIHKWIIGRIVWDRFDDPDLDGYPPEASLWRDHKTGELAFACGYRGPDRLLYSRGILYASGHVAEALALADVSYVENPPPPEPHQQNLVEYLVDRDYVYFPDMEDPDSPSYHELSWPGWCVKNYVESQWLDKWGRVPRDYDIVGDEFSFSHDQVISLGRAIGTLNFKVWLRHAKELGNDGATSHDRVGLLMSCSLSGWSSGSIDQLSRYGNNWNDIWETFRGVPDNRVRLLKKSQASAFVNALKCIPADIDISGMKVGAIIAMASEYTYMGVLDKSVAHAADLAGLTQSEFIQYQNYWMRRPRKGYETIPDIGTVVDGAYKMYRLHTDDPRGPMLGLLTNCCQHLEGEGEGSSCARHGAENPDGAFFVVEKHGKIIAQSWTWRAGQTVCFDNVEALSDDYMDVIANLYQATANRLVGKLGIARVTVGSGYDDLDVGKYWYTTDYPGTPPSGVYTDAGRVQYLVAGEMTTRE